MKYIIILILFVTEPCIAQNRFVVIDALNFRDAPNLNSTIKTRLTYKDTVIQISNKANWSNIIWNLDTGWVYSNYIVDSIIIQQYFEETVQTAAICNDGTAQTRLTANTCKNNGGIKEYLYKTYVFKNGRKQFILDKKFK